MTPQQQQQQQQPVRDQRTVSWTALPASLAPSRVDLPTHSSDQASPSRDDARSWLGGFLLQQQRNRRDHVRALQQQLAQQFEANGDSSSEDEHDTIQADLDQDNRRGGGEAGATAAADNEPLVQELSRVITRRRRRLVRRDHRQRRPLRLNEESQLSSAYSASLSLPQPSTSSSPSNIYAVPSEPLPIRRVPIVIVEEDVDVEEESRGRYSLRQRKPIQQMPYTIDAQNLPAFLRKRGRRNAESTAAGTEEDQTQTQTQSMDQQVVDDADNADAESYHGGSDSDSSSGSMDAAVDDISTPHSASRKRNRRISSGAENDTAAQVDGTISGITAERIARLERLKATYSKKRRQNLKKYSASGYTPEILQNRQQRSDVNEHDVSRPPPFVISDGWRRQDIIDNAQHSTPTSSVINGRDLFNDDDHDDNTNNDDIHSINDNSTVTSSQPLLDSPSVRRHLAFVPRDRTTTIDAALGWNNSSSSSSSSSSKDVVDLTGDDYDVPSSTGSARQRILSILPRHILQQQHDHQSQLLRRIRRSGRFNSKSQFSISYLDIFSRQFAPFLESSASAKSSNQWRSGRRVIPDWARIAQRSISTNSAELGDFIEFETPWHKRLTCRHDPKRVKESCKGRTERQQVKLAADEVHGLWTAVGKKGVNGLFRQTGNYALGDDADRADYKAAEDEEREEYYESDNDSDFSTYSRDDNNKDTFRYINEHGDGAYIDYDDGDGQSGWFDDMAGESDDDDGDDGDDSRGEEMARTQHKQNAAYIFGEDLVDTFDDSNTRFGYGFGSNRLAGYQQPQRHSTTMRSSHPRNANISVPRRKRRENRSILDFVDREGEAIEDNTLDGRMRAPVRRNNVLRSSASSRQSHQQATRRPITYSSRGIAEGTAIAKRGAQRDSPRSGRGGNSIKHWLKQSNGSLQISSIEANRPAQQTHQHQQHQQHQRLHTRTTSTSDTRPSFTHSRSPSATTPLSTVAPLVRASSSSRLITTATATSSSPSSSSSAAAAAAAAATASASTLFSDGEGPSSRNKPTPRPMQVTLQGLGFVHIDNFGFTQIQPSPANVQFRGPSFDNSADPSSTVFVVGSSQVLLNRRLDETEPTLVLAFTSLCGLLDSFTTLTSSTAAALESVLTLSGQVFRFACAYVTLFMPSQDNELWPSLIQRIVAELTRLFDKLAQLDASPALSPAARIRLTVRVSILELLLALDRQGELYKRWLSLDRLAGLDQRMAWLVCVILNDLIAHGHPRPLSIAFNGSDIYEISNWIQLCWSRSLVLFSSPIWHEARFTELLQHEQYASVFTSESIWAALFEIFATKSCPSVLLTDLTDFSDINSLQPQQQRQLMNDSTAYLNDAWNVLYRFLSIISIIKSNSLHSIWSATVKLIVQRTVRLVKLCRSDKSKLHPDCKKPADGALRDLLFRMDDILTRWRSHLLPSGVLEALPLSQIVEPLAKLFQNEYKFDATSIDGTTKAYPSWMSQSTASSLTTTALSTDPSMRAESTFHIFLHVFEALFSLSASVSVTDSYHSTNNKASIWERVSRNILPIKVVKFCLSDIDFSAAAQTSISRQQTAAQNTYDGTSYISLRNRFSLILAIFRSVPFTAWNTSCVTRLTRLMNFSVSDDPTARRIQINGIVTMLEFMIMQPQQQLPVLESMQLAKSDTNLKHTTHIEHVIHELVLSLSKMISTLSDETQLYTQHVTEIRQSPLTVAVAQTDRSSHRHTAQASSISTTNNTRMMDEATRNRVIADYEKRLVNIKSLQLLILQHMVGAVRNSRAQLQSLLDSSEPLDTDLAVLRILSASTLVSILMSKDVWSQLKSFGSAGEDGRRGSTGANAGFANALSDLVESIAATIALLVDLFASNQPPLVAAQRFVDGDDMDMEFDSFDLHESQIDELFADIDTGSSIDIITAQQSPPRHPPPLLLPATSAPQILSFTWTYQLVNIMEILLSCIEPLVGHIHTKVEDLARNDSIQAARSITTNDVIKRRRENILDSKLMRYLNVLANTVSASERLSSTITAARTHIPPQQLQQEQQRQQRQPARIAIDSFFGQFQRFAFVIPGDSLTHTLLLSQLMAEYCIATLSQQRHQQQQQQQQQQQPVVNWSSYTVTEALRLWFSSIMLTPVSPSVIVITHIFCHIANQFPSRFGSDFAVVAMLFRNMPLVAVSDSAALSSMLSSTVVNARSDFTACRALLVEQVLFNMDADPLTSPMSHCPHGVSIQLQLCTTCVSTNSQHISLLLTTLRSEYIRMSQDLRIDKSLLAQFVSMAQRIVATLEGYAEMGTNASSTQLLTQSSQLLLAPTVDRHLVINPSDLAFFYSHEFPHPPPSLTVIRRLRGFARRPYATDLDTMIQLVEFVYAQLELPFIASASAVDNEHVRILLDGLSQYGFQHQSSSAGASIMWNDSLSQLRRFLYSTSWKRTVTGWAQADEARGLNHAIALLDVMSTLFDSDVNHILYSSDAHSSSCQFALGQLVDEAATMLPVLLDCVQITRNYHLPNSCTAEDRLRFGQFVEGVLGLLSMHLRLLRIVQAEYPDVSRMRWANSLTAVAAEAVHCIILQYIIPKCASDGHHADRLTDRIRSDGSRWHTVLSSISQFGYPKVDLFWQRYHNEPLPFHHVARLATGSETGTARHDCCDVAIIASGLELCILAVALERELGPSSQIGIDRMLASYLPQLDWDKVNQLCHSNRHIHHAFTRLTQMVGLHFYSTTPSHPSNPNSFISLIV
ncbi:hypothetical protein GQ42DRAFT_73301 [Ramicandelaber brevisporus]|nr:hypothetical protein GQ42DRAFT_73301 [Ramicandelaber brevisporus]